MRVIALVILLFIGRAEADLAPISVSVQFNGESCELFWVVANKSRAVVHLSNAELPWQEGLFGAELKVFADGQVVPQKRFSFDQYIGYVDIPPLSSATERVALSTALRQWDLPSRRELEVIWRYKLVRKNNHYAFDGKFTVLKKCVVLK